MSERFPGADRLARERLIRQGVVLAALVLVLVGVALLWPRPALGAFTVATTTTQVKPTGVLQGPIEASRRGTHVCYSVTVRGTTSVLRFEQGWSANRELDLLDAGGSVAAPPGATVRMLGAPGSVGTVPGCSQRGRIWTITQVRLLRT